ncbi:YacL family protein [Enterovibrio makurazakiensis]|uniref:YacL family protein n=1 Tax=Enterovibrio gelatinilyticus TaxID=2899819 RepID=A0ABT5QVD3_9GAMM|nr:YacL family protein [Enterovibrio sp. ZSDZ42]MDD1791964.1 YacL family protein [Enterovibrio sp. ZSDZ42]
MDYEFRRNTLDDSFHAELPMGHEALGRWLIDELGTDHAEIDNVLNHLQAVMAQGGEWNRAGKVFHLQLTQEEALVQANVLIEGYDEEMPENDLHTYEEESMSLCGPEDLAVLLEAWQDFIRRYGR